VPAKGIYPTIIPFVTVFQADDGLKTAQSGVIRTKTELQSILPRQSSYLAAKVDFEKEQLIFVALGECKSGGEARIDTVMFLSDRGNGLPSLTEVGYKEVTPHGAAAVDPDAAQAAFPMHVIKLKKLDGETSFNKN
jgi:hypothetical protein